MTKEFSDSSPNVAEAYVGLLTNAVLELEPKSDKDLRNLLEFLRTNVTSEDLIADRLAQAFIDEFLGHARHTDAKGSSERPSDKIGNPYPTIKYRFSDNRGFGYRRGTFMIENDDDNLYFFDGGYPIETPFLRSQDIISAKSYDRNKTPNHQARTGLPFNKPLERTLIKGGTLQLYNYNTNDWETRASGLQCEMISETVKKSTMEKAVRVISQSR